MAACKAEAEKNNWKVAIAIVDDGGYLLSFDRMDGAAPITAEVAVGKAHCSALTRRPSKFFEYRVKERPAFAVFPAGILIQGAVPIMVRGRLRRRDRRVRRRVAPGRAGGAGGRQRSGLVGLCVTDGIGHWPSPPVAHSSLTRGKG